MQRSIRRLSTGRLSSAALAVTLAAVTLCSGCERGSSVRGSVVLVGVVEGSRANTELLLIRVIEPRPSRPSEERVVCRVPGNAEFYVNDRFTPFEEVEIGDRVELMGYYDQTGPRDAQFVVLFASISRNEPPPPEVDLSVPPTQPIDQPQES